MTRTQLLELVQLGFVEYLDPPPNLGYFAQEVQEAHNRYMKALAAVVGAARDLEGLRLGGLRRLKEYTEDKQAQALHSFQMADLDAPRGESDLRHPVFAVRINGGAFIGCFHRKNGLSYSSSCHFRTPVEAICYAMLHQIGTPPELVAVDSEGYTIWWGRSKEAGIVLDSSFDFPALAAGQTAHVQTPYYGEVRVTRLEK